MATSSTSVLVPTSTKKRIEPILLTHEQIKSILDDIPKLPGVGRTAQIYLLADLKGKLYDKLRTIKLVPKEEAFAEFKREVLYSLMNSLIEPGRPVGITAAVSISRPITQLTLNSFHFAGSRSGIANAFEKIKDLVTGTKTVKVPQTNIFFKVPKDDPDLHTVIHDSTYEDILNRKATFEQTTLQDLVADAEIIYRDDAIREGVHELLRIQSILYPQGRFDFMQRQKLTAVFKLTLNTYRMYTHKITMKMVADAIEYPAMPDVLTCVWRSLNAGVIYVLVDESLPFAQNIKTGKYLNDQAGALTVFFNREIKPKFDKFLVKGISGIIYLEPKTVEVLNGIYKIAKREKSYQVYTTNERTRWIGISLGDIKQLLERAGFTVNDLTPENKANLYVDVIGGNGINFENTEQFLDIENIVLEKLKRAKENIQQRKTEVNLNSPQGTERVQVGPNEDDLLVRASTFCYTEAHGTNMKELCWYEEVDNYRTVNNNPHEIADLFGIDAARIYLIFKFREVLTSFSSYISARHIALIFDMLTNLGFVNSLSFSGTNRRKPGAFTLASHERAAEVFMKAGIVGSKESTNTVSSSIYIGKQPENIGTGLTQVIEDEYELEEITVSAEPQIVETGGDEILAGEVIAGSKYENLFEAAAEEQNNQRIVKETPKPIDAPLSQVVTETGESAPKPVFTFDSLKNLTLNMNRPSPNLATAVEQNIKENRYIMTPTATTVAETSQNVCVPAATAMKAVPEKAKISNTAPPKIVMPDVRLIPRRPGRPQVKEEIAVQLPVVQPIAKPVVASTVSGRSFLDQYLGSMPMATEVGTQVQTGPTIRQVPFIDPGIYLGYLPKTSDQQKK